MAWCDEGRLVESRLIFIPGGALAWIDGISVFDAIHDIERRSVAVRRNGQQRAAARRWCGRYSSASPQPSVNGNATSADIDRDAH